MTTFHYSSVKQHGILTPEGNKVKITKVNVANNKGKKIVIIKDHKGVHSDTQNLNKTEIKNIKNHKFMPKLFSLPMYNVLRKKNTKKHRQHKKVTRKLKK